MIRNRIKCHRRIRVGDLVPHEANFRRHTDRQKMAVSGMIRDVGFARSLVGYELADGRVKLIDGHLRKSELNENDVVDVEILDVTDDEARLLLATIDPLGQMAETDAATLEVVVAQAATVTSALDDLFSRLAAPEPAAPVEVAVQSDTPATCPKCAHRFFAKIDRSQKN